MDASDMAQLLLFYKYSKLIKLFSGAFICPYFEQL